MLAIPSRSYFILASRLRAAAQSKPDAIGRLVASPTIPCRLTQAIDETVRAPRGNVTPRRRNLTREWLGDATPMKRMMLVLQRGPNSKPRSANHGRAVEQDSPIFIMAYARTVWQAVAAGRGQPDSNRLASNRDSAIKGWSRTHSHRILRERGAVRNAFHGNPPFNVTANPARLT